MLSHECCFTSLFQWLASWSTEHLTMVLILLVEATVLVEADICFFNFQLMHDKIISVPYWITNCLLLMPGDAAIEAAEIDIAITRFRGLFTGKRLRMSN